MARLPAVVAALIVSVATLSSQTHPTAAARFRALADKDGFETALAWLAGLGAEQKSHLTFDEKEFLALGKELKSSGRVEEAIRFLGVATELFLQSSDVWEALGTCQLRALRKADATASFEKALQVNPKSRSARGQLQAIDRLLEMTRDETRVKAVFTPGGPTRLTGPYLGQPPPGRTPVLFAAGIVSVYGSDENTLTVTPDGREIYFGKEAAIWVCRLTGTGWTAPQRTEIPGYEMWISPHTGTMYYTGYEPGIWAMERRAQGWGSPRRLVAKGMFSTLTSDETLYTTVFDERGKANVGRYMKQNGAYATAETFGAEINSPNSFDAHPNVSPDGRFLVFDSDRPEGIGLYIARRRADGSWGRARYLGQALAGGSLSTFSPDGRYLFFMRHRDIYWVSAAVLDEPARSVQRPVTAMPADRAPSAVRRGDSR